MTNARAEADLDGSAKAGLAIAVLLIAFAAWRVLTLGIALFEVDAAPLRALSWRASLPEAVLNLEEQRLEGNAPAGANPAVLEAIARGPLHPLGYRQLARQAELAGDETRAVALYGLAAQRGPRDLPSLARVARHELARGEYAAALRKFDQMMRVQPEFDHLLAPVLLAVAAHKPAQHDFADLLGKRPPWREGFMGRLFTQSTDTAAIFPLVERLRETPPGLSDQELAAWIDRLAREGQWGAAYLTWVQSLGPERSEVIGNVYNGGFELEPSQLGFDWQYKSVPGASISRTQTTGATKRFALRLEFEDRRITFPSLRQMLALAPGHYRLRGRVRLDDLRSERGLVWTLSCVRPGTPIGETPPMAGRHDWRPFETEFTVPKSDCGGQWLTLVLPARIQAETRIGGTAWFDDMSIKSN